jgi:hypothetical protein
MVEISANYHPQVLLLGNGINLGYGGLSWKELLKKISDGRMSEEDIDKLCSPMPLSAILVTEDHVDDAIKEHEKEFYGKVTDGLRMPLEGLLRIGFDDILTTNYSYELEAAAAHRETVSEYFIKKNCHNIEDGKKVDSQYLLHSYQSAPFEEVENRVWHIHGEARKPSSMILGHYYYASLLHRMSEYLQGQGNRYQKRQKENTSQTMKSWLDSFILGDVYILGFGMDFAELDLWWLLNRKKRENAHHGKVYFYEPKPNGFCEKHELLKLMDVQLIHLDTPAPEGTNEEKTRAYQEFYRKAIFAIGSKVTQAKSIHMEGI